MTDVHVPEATQLSIRYEGSRVYLIINGRLALDMTWQQALELGRTLMGQARKAEEIAKVEQVVMDQAMLMRAGFPLRMATNDHMLKLAGNEAAWNSDLRRYMPNKLDKIEQYGTMYAPVVTKEKKP